jgi:hypothetical protein
VAAAVDGSLAAARWSVASARLAEPARGCNKSATTAARDSSATACGRRDATAPQA